MESRPDVEFRDEHRGETLLAARQIPRMGRDENDLECVQDLERNRVADRRWPRLCFAEWVAKHG